MGSDLFAGATDSRAAGWWWFAAISISVLVIIAIFGFYYRLKDHYMEYKRQKALNASGSGLLPGQVENV